MSLIVISLTNVDQQLRGYITHYVMEVYTGTYIGNCSQRVRELLWERIKDDIDGRKSGKAMIAWSTNNEQGYDLLIFGFDDRYIRDNDGIMQIVHKSQKNNAYQHTANNHKKHWSKAYYRKR